MSWADSLTLNQTDGIVILHRGKIVHERDFGALNAERQHIAFSVRKSFFGTLPGWSYHHFWWVSHDHHGVYMARGIHGQAIYVDPKAEMVIARFASHPLAGNVNLDPLSLPAYRAVAEYLMEGGK